MEKKRNIAILGSTGSIGRQTLDVLAEHPDLFAPYLLVANRSVELLAEQALRFKPHCVIIGDESLHAELCRRLEGTGIRVLSGSKAIAEEVTDPVIDTVVTAMVGYSGLAPTINAIRAGKDIALANKETLVVAGELITSLVKQHGTHLYPVDSEHGAIYQCLVGEDPSTVSKLLLTASGGPFRTCSKDELQYMTKADALHHPNWNMGAKITIDSATMMNKGFEVIEAKWLFGIDAADIEVVVHPQSIVHSMVEFIDGSVKAQLGLPDMHLPIRYALGLPGRLASVGRRLSVSDYATLTFERPDMDKFPLLGMAFEAIGRGGNVPCVMNAANEVAVDAFLHDRIRFTDIADIVERTIAASAFVEHPAYDDYVLSNQEARREAAAMLNA